jgi:hypothetical protein
MQAPAARIDQVVQKIVEQEIQLTTAGRLALADKVRSSPAKTGTRDEYSTTQPSWSSSGISLVTLAKARVLLASAGRKERSGILA